jgi:nitrogen fixation protein NifB
VQCNFCNRKFDCANESRPGVTTSILKPIDAVDYLEKTIQRVPNIAVVGIAGPGDPFANPKETMQTLELTHERFPDQLLCVSSNGLSISEYIPRLAELKVSHVTITVNAVDPVIGAQIYEWIHFEGKTYSGLEGATLLLERQTEAIKRLKEHGITVKINSVVIPRVNEYHIQDIARYTSELGADIQNCIPLIPVAGTPFGVLHEPTASNMRMVRAKTSVYIKQMSHCSRCRADAVGLLNADINASESAIQNNKVTISFAEKPFIAVATADGKRINQHLGQAANLLIYQLKDGQVELRENRPTSLRHKSDRWNDIADILSDCAILLVNGIGQTPLRVLTNRGVVVESVSGNITEIAGILYAGKPMPDNYLRLSGSCGAGVNCSGNGVNTSGCLN